MEEIERLARAGAPVLGAAAQGEESDRELLRAVQSGDAAAADRLVARHWGRAHRIAYGVLGDAHAAEDVTQEAMVSLVANAGRFDLRRPFGPWLHRTVVNRALNWARSERRRPERPFADAELHEEQTANPNLATTLSAALASLSPEHRAVVALRYIGGYSPDEIAALLKLRRGTVGSRLRRALDRLRTEMEESDG